MAWLMEGRARGSRGGGLPKQSLAAGPLGEGNEEKGHVQHGERGAMEGGGGGGILPTLLRRGSELGPIKHVPMPWTGADDDEDDESDFAENYGEEYYPPGFK